MLTTAEIKQIIDTDAASKDKDYARVGQRYMEGNHDIKSYRMFYYNSDGQLTEDRTRANTKIPHPFFKELTEQGTQYILSGSEGIIKSQIPELQNVLDDRFNNNDDFISELADVITDTQSKGCSYMYCMKNSQDKLQFTFADMLGVSEVDSRFTSDKKDHIIYHYTDRKDAEGNSITRIMDWDDEQIYYYVQTDGGEVIPDPDAVINPRPHVVYELDGDENKYQESFGFIPFFRLDNNKKQSSNLVVIKDLIDDYDFMASSLSNNLIDFDHPLYVVKGFEGDNLDELQTNLKTKKMIGVSPDGDVQVHTVDVPYEARKTKLELDEKNIYRFGMGLNLSGLKDTAATTNIAIKAAYSLLDLRCKHLERSIKKFLREIINVTLDEINQQEGTAYKTSDIYFEFTHEVMSNEKENKEIELLEAQAVAVLLDNLLKVNNILDRDTIIQRICEVLDIDYEEIKDKLPEDAMEDLSKAQKLLEGEINEQGSEGSPIDSIK